MNTRIAISFFAVIALAQSQQISNPICEVKYGSSWLLVRHTASGPTWGPFTDNASGTDSCCAPTATSSATSSDTWSHLYDQYSYSKMMFALADYAHWVIINSESITTIEEGFSSDNITLLQSDISTSSYDVVFYNRFQNFYPEDPWISNRDHHYLDSEPVFPEGETFSMLYGEAGFEGWTEWIQSHGGANVYISDDTGLCAPAILHADAAHSTVLGSGLVGGNSGAVYTFTIQANDINGQRVYTGGDAFTVQISAPGGAITATVLDQQDGTYTVSFTASKNGKYTISVLLDGQNVLTAQPIFNPGKGKSVSTRTVVGGVGILGVGLGGIILGRKWYMKRSKLMQQAAADAARRGSISMSTTSTSVVSAPAVPAAVDAAVV